MFKLPVCPHCGTVYRYKEVREAIKQKKTVCYHCQNKFKARFFPDILVGALIPISLSIGINIYLMTRMENLELIPLFAVALAAVFTIYMIVPFFTRFVKDKDKEK